MYPIRTSKWHSNFWKYRSELNLGVEHSGFTLVKSGRYYDPNDPYILVKDRFIAISSSSPYASNHKHNASICRAAIMFSSSTKTSRRTWRLRDSSTSRSLRTVCSFSFSQSRNQPNSGHHMYMYWISNINVQCIYGFGQWTSSTRAPSARPRRPSRTGNLNPRRVYSSVRCSICVWQNCMDYNRLRIAQIMQNSRILCRRLVHVAPAGALQEHVHSQIPLCRREVLGDAHRRPERPAHCL